MPTSTTLPVQTTPVFATDEDCLVRAGGDFALLAPPWQQMAAGADGIFAPSAPWILTSASVNFTANGVVPCQVVRLTAPKSVFPGGGHFLAIDSVATNTITLRRPHKDLNVGQPPAPAAGLTSVAFSIATLDPQIEEASYVLKHRYSINDLPGVGTFRSSSWLYEIRELREATVLTVLLQRYLQETRTDRGDFPGKVQRIRQELDDVMARVQLRWGSQGNSAPPSTLFSCRISR